MLKRTPQDFWTSRKRQRINNESSEETEENGNEFGKISSFIFSKHRQSLQLI